MAQRPINVVIKGDYTDKDIKRAIRDLGSLQKQGPKTGKALSGVTKSFLGLGAALGGTFALSSVVSTIGDMTTSAMDDQKAVAGLGKTLANIGQKSALVGLEDSIAAMSKQYAVADEQLRPALQKLITATGDVSKSQETMGLALDIAAGTGKSLESVTTALARAYNGNTTALSRLGAGLDKTLLKTGDMDAITAELSRKFRGQASTAADTFSGRIASLGITVDEAKETIGYGLVAAIDDVSTALGGSDGMVSWIESTATQTADLVEGVGSLTAGLIDLSKQLGVTGQSGDGFMDWVKEKASEMVPLLGDMQTARDLIAGRGQAERFVREFQQQQSAVITDRYSGIAQGGGGERFAAGMQTQRTASGGTTYVYNFTGGIRVDSSAALTEVQKQAARLAALAGNRYAGMAETGQGYRR